MIELEKHLYTLELNLYGESTGANLVSGSRNSRSAPSRHNQSLHAIHNATISQLAAAKQLSDSLSKQMAVLSIKSSPTNKANVKKPVFESTGIPYPDETLHSPNTVKVMDSPSNRHPLVSYSGETRKDSSRIQLSSVSSHDLETARRRRDSLDRSWANFEAPKTTVKRTVIQNDHQKVAGLFSSMDKKFISPCKLEGSTATYSKILAVQDGSGHRDAPQKITADIAATSKFKWAGGIPDLSQAEIEQPPKWQLLQGDSFSAIQNMSSSSSTSSSIISAFVDPNMNKGITHFTTERRGTQVGNIDRYDIASGDRDSSVLQIGDYGEEKITPQKIQPQLFSFPIKGGQMPNFGAKETALTKPVAGQSSSHISTSKQGVESSPSTVLSPIKGGQTPILGGKETELTKPVDGQSFSDVSTIKHGVESSPSTVLAPVSSVSLHNSSMQTLTLNSVEGGYTTSTKMSQVFSKEVLQFPPSVISVCSSFAAPVSSVTPRNSKEVSELPMSVLSVSASQTSPVISVSSKGTEIVDSESSISFVKPAKEPLNMGPQTATNKVSVGNNLATTQFPEKPSPSSNEALNFSESTPSSSTEFPKALASCSDTNKIVSNVSGMVSNNPVKQSTAVTPSPISTTQLGGAPGGKSDVDATVAQEDEMEEEAPETNQMVDLSLGSLAGFGFGSASSATVPKSNPFGCLITSAPQTMPSSIFLTVSSGELFRPTTFSFQSLQASQPSQSLGGGFGFTNPLQQNSSGSGFGQRSQIGLGQQDLGSVLGSFGQSRQLGASLPGSGFGASQSPGGGFLNASASGGFAGIGSTTSGFGSGFATTASSRGGFAAVATGGGFAAAAPTGGGFVSAAPGAGGFAAVAPSGGGFAAATPNGGEFTIAVDGGGGFLITGASGGFAGIGSTTSGFSSGFATTTSSGGGFAAVATGRGFAAAAPIGGGFVSTALGAGGFATAAPSGGGFAAATPSGGGGFLNTGASVGFAGIGSTTSGFRSGFATSASSGGGFTAVATGGGFAVAAPTGGGFVSAALGEGGFVAAAPSRGGFAAVTPSGGGGFLNAGASGGFVGIGSTTSGFSSVFATSASSGGGFTAVATGGRFAVAAPTGGGFVSAALGAGGFAAAAPIRGGFAAVTLCGGCGFLNAGASGRYAGIGSTTSGFATAASSGGSFAAVATRGGFAAAAPTGSGFFSAASGVGGFAAAAPSGGGFAAATPSGGGGSLNACVSCGFAGIGSITSGFGSGFATVPCSGGDFAAVATGGGFAAAAPTGGRFVSAAPGAGGFAAAAPSGGGFATATPSGVVFTIAVDGGGGFLNTGASPRSIKRFKSRLRKR